MGGGISGSYTAGDTGRQMLAQGGRWETGCCLPSWEVAPLPLGVLARDVSDGMEAANRRQRESGLACGCLAWGCGARGPPRGAENFRAAPPCIQALGPEVMWAREEEVLSVVQLRAWL